jgi:hypothetical protein
MKTQLNINNTACDVSPGCHQLLTVLPFPTTTPFLKIFFLLHNIGITFFVFSKTPVISKRHGRKSQQQLIVSLEQKKTTWVSHNPRNGKKMDKKLFFLSANNFFVSMLQPLKFSCKWKWTGLKNTLTSAQRWICVFERTYLFNETWTRLSKIWDSWEKK